MAEPQPAVESPEWWRERLGKVLDLRQHEMATYQQYYDGRHPLAFASDKFREAFGGRLRAFADNFCPLVVEAVEERLTVQGFRLGAARDLAADTDAWRIWQTNQLDAESELAHREALIKGCGYVLVSPSETDRVDDETPGITVEDPMEVATESEPGRRWKRRAGIKRWVDDEGMLRAVLWLPDFVYRWRSEKPFDPVMKQAGDIRWKEFSLPADEDRWPIPNPLGIVPLVPLPNKPLRDGSFASEIRNVIPAQDAINKTAADLLVAQEFAAFRQRYALNLDLEIDPETKLPRLPFKVGVDRMITIGRPDQNPDGTYPPPTTFGEFGVSELSQYIRGMEMWVQHIATQTRTPAHYLLGQAGSFPSGESLKATETGLVSKARHKMRYFGEGWEEVIRLAFRVLDDPRAEVMDSETIWKDPETRTEAEHVDALLKLKSIGVPDEQLQEDAGYSPQQIRRFARIKARDALLNPPPPVVTPFPQPQQAPNAVAS
jgi:hypothetical protein